MGKISPTSSTPMSDLPASTGEQLPVPSERSDSVSLDQDSFARLGMERTSFSAKVVRFFVSILEALRLRRPASTTANSQQEIAASQFRSMVQAGQQHAVITGRDASALANARIAQNIDTELVNQHAFEKEVVQISAQTKIGPRCDQFYNTVKQKTGEDISNILQRKSVAEHDSMPGSRSFTALPPWMEYQNNLRALARMRSHVAGADASRDHDAMLRVAAELTPNALDLHDDQLYDVSRRYRQASDALSGFLRSCCNEDSNENIKLAAHHLQLYEAALQPNLAAKSTLEKELVHDLLFDNALNRLTLQERNKLTASLKEDGQLFHQVFAAVDSEHHAAGQKIADAMQRHATTRPFMPSAGFSSQSPIRQQVVQQALASSRARQAAASSSRPTAEEAAINYYGHVIFDSAYHDLTAAEQPLVAAGGRLRELLTAAAHDHKGSQTEAGLREFSSLIGQAQQKSRATATEIPQDRLLRGKTDQASTQFLSAALQGKDERGVQLISDTLFNHAWGQMSGQEKGALLESLRHHQSGIEHAISKPYTDHERRMLNCLISSMKNHPVVSPYLAEPSSAYR